MGAPSDSAELGRDSRVGVVLADRYRIDSLVDKGAMGRVYLAEHVLMKKRVAIKVLHRELTMVPEFVARFEREAMAAANIDSEHVVAATDFGKLPDGAVYLVLEFIEGRNLRDEMQRGPMPVARALHVTSQIAEALKSAHALGIVHRDLKPENVMLVPKGGDPDFVKVLDFGIAKVPIGEIGKDEGPNSRPITKAGMVFGTPEYMPPEQALGQSVDARADLYALGVMTFEMLAGCRPFAAKSQVGILGQQISEVAPPVSQRAKNVTIPEAVERFIQKLLEREASARYQTAAEVLRVIEQKLGYIEGKSRIPTRPFGSLATADTEHPPPLPSFGDQYGEDDLPTSRFSIPGESRSLDGLSRWMDDRRSRLPEPLRRLPAPVLFSVPLAAAGLVIGFGVVSAMGAPKEKPRDAVLAATTASAATVKEPPAPPRTAPSADIVTAMGKGRDALVVLRARFPEDGAVALAQSGFLLKEKDPEGATQSLADALSLDPTLTNNAQVSSALFILAQNKKSSARAFEILKGPMHARGLTILKDLATTAGVRPAVREQARRALDGSESTK